MFNSCVAEKSGKKRNVILTMFNQLLQIKEKETEEAKRKSQKEKIQGQKVFY
jgi:hypothetical protein